MKGFKKILSFLLACIMLVGILAACTPATGEPLLTLEDQSISVNTFYLYLSRMKGYLTLATSMGGYGEQANQDTFWDTLMDASGKTYDEYYTEQLLDNVKTYLAAMSLFEERGLKLPDETMSAIDEELQEILDNKFGGSKDEMNAELANYGANYEVLREAHIIEAKIALLREDLFGTDGSKISADYKNGYYKTHYRRFKQLSFATYRVATEVDKNTGEEKVITDPTTGYAKQIPMTEKEIQQVIDRVHEIYKMAVVNEDETSFLEAWKDGESGKGDFALFDALLTETDEDGKLIYNDNDVSEAYPNGIYAKASDQSDAPEVLEAVFEMNVGDVRVVRTEDRFFIVMRYDNDDGAYANKENAQSFKSFLSAMENDLLAEYLQPYKENIVVDEALLDAISMKNVTANTTY